MTALQENFEPLLRCHHCRAEMKLLGIETRGLTQEIYTFQCPSCERIEGRSLSLGSDSSLS